MQEISIDMLGQIRCAGASSKPRANNNAAGTNYNDPNAAGTDYHDAGRGPSTSDWGGLAWAAFRAVTSPASALFYSPSLANGEVTLPDYHEQCINPAIPSPITRSLEP